MASPNGIIVFTIWATILGCEYQNHTSAGYSTLTG